MTTSEINATRLDLYNGNEATLLVAATRWRLLAQEQQRRVIAIGRCVNGGAFKVTAPVAPPADFAEAVAAYDGRRQHTVRLSDEALAEIENEKIGEDVGRQPFLY